MVPYERYQKLKRKGKELQVVSNNAIIPEYIWCQDLGFDRLSRELEKSRKRLRNLRREKEQLLDRICIYEKRNNNITSDSDSNSSSDGEDAENNIQNNIIQHHQIQHNHNRHQKLNGTLTIKGNPSKKPLNTKTMKVQYVEKDGEGNYKLPVQVGILTVLDLGHVVYDREAFHNDRYIFPVGYTIRRSYNSMIDPNNQTMYTCKIEDGGSGPKFIIEPDDRPGKSIIANTATGAWTTVVREANAIRQRNHSNSASGPDYYGFSQATIRKMIQDLPNAARCKNYLLQSFEVMKSRNGAGGSGNKRRLLLDAGGSVNKRRRVNGSDAGVNGTFSVDNRDFDNGNRSDGTMKSQNTV
nr:8589_t:CDS:2 [Entrophospora candida]CAG8450477.1 10519_t:CDS:2 [Entrophospora candida]